jgi:hypothetical protein
MVAVADGARSRNIAVSVAETDGIERNAQRGRCDSSWARFSLSVLGNLVILFNFPFTPLFNMYNILHHSTRLVSLGICNCMVYIMGL